MASSVFGLLALFPRLPKGAQGLVFWEDIRNHGTAEAYVTATGRASGSGVESEYARQNFHTSKVLHSKIVLVRWTIGLLCVGLGTFLVALWRQ